MSAGFSSKQLAVLLGAELLGEVRQITSLDNIENAGPNSVVVISRKNQLNNLNSSLGLVVLTKGLSCTNNRIEVDDPRRAFAKLSKLFDNNPPIANGLEQTAILHPSAKIASSARLAENVVIKANVIISDNTQIGANTVIGENTVIGKDCTIFPNVTVYPNTIIKDRVIIHSGTVVGSDGFGYAFGATGAEKVHHLGNIVLENDVEIGSNCSLDRATLGSTVIGERTKIDNLCQIAHNVELGTDCLIAACSVVAGSTTLGNRVIMGGGVGVVDHIHIGSDVKIRGYSGVTKSIPDGQTWAGDPARPYKQYTRGLYLQNRLEQIWATVKEIKRD